MTAKVKGYQKNDNSKTKNADTTVFNLSTTFT